jgi:hypothetical protein
MRCMQDGIRNRAVKTALILMIAAMAVCGGCGKVQDKLQGINAWHVAEQFFGAWKKQDWKTLYAMTDSSFINTLRMQKLSPEQQRMSDEELFVHEFRQAQRMNPDRILKSYEIRHIPPYKKGDTTVWVYAVVNGREKKIPMTLDGWSLKIDLTRIE